MPLILIFLCCYDIVSYIAKKVYIMKLSLLLILPILLFSCTNDENDEKKLAPSHSYTFVDITKKQFKIHQIEYVPVYSEIYYRDGRNIVPLTTTLSLRNISIHDTVYIAEVNYHDSYGTLLHNYIGKTLMLRPLESVEYVVEHLINKGGVGANFIVEWGSLKEKTKAPLIQAVMIGTSGGQGISLITNGIILNEDPD